MIYSFHQFRVDKGRDLFFCEDQPVGLEPLAFALLLYLIENRDRVVSRNELMDKLWSGKVVTESAVNARLRDVRKAIGDSGERQQMIKTFHARGYQFIAPVVVEVTESVPVESKPPDVIGLAQQSPVRFCQASDGISIAHAQVGSGPPLIVTGSWITHLVEDWGEDGWSRFLSELARNFTLIRYDVRGNGMSDWDNVEITFEKLVEDLGLVIDAYDYDQVAIFGPSASAAVSIAYSLQNPERVSRLVLYGGYAQGVRHRGNPGEIAESEAMVTLIREAWGRDNPVARQMMTTLYTPDASQEEAAEFNEFQKTCGPAENIARFREIYDDVDVLELLDQISTPTLVIHCIQDSISPYSQGKILADKIPNAQFVTLNSKAHLIGDTDPEFQRLLHKVRQFLLP